MVKATIYVNWSEEEVYNEKEYLEKLNEDLENYEVLDEDDCAFVEWAEEIGKTIHEIFMTEGEERKKLLASYRKYIEEEYQRIKNIEKIEIDI